MNWCVPIPFNTIFSMDNLFGVRIRCIDFRDFFLLSISKKIKLKRKKTKPLYNISLCHAIHFNVTRKKKKNDEMNESQIW